MSGERVDHSREHIAYLQMMTNELQRELPEGYFDKEDVTYVTNLLDRLQKEEQERTSRERLLKNQNIQRLQKLEKIVKKRQIVLDKISQDTSLFEDFPDLLQFFHEKQVRLLEMLAAIKKECSKLT